MKDSTRDTRKRVPSSPEFPPGIDAPGPPQVRDASTGETVPADVVQDIHRIAERVGGLARLRTLVNELARNAHE